MPIKKFDYNVIRTEKNSGPFKQIKVFALVDIKIDSLNKKAVCIDIKNEFNKYANIVICLYANNDIGKNLVNIIMANNGYKIFDLGIKCIPESC